MSKIRVLLVDDHTVIREGLRVLLDSQHDIQVIAEACDGQSACAFAMESKPDVVVMDISMPGMNGARATESIRRACPDTRVLALTVHEDNGYLRLLVKAGASGYVLKRAASQDLIHAIRVVAAGKSYLDTTLAGDIMDGLSESLQAED